MDRKNYVCPYLVVSHTTFTTIANNRNANIFIKAKNRASVYSNFYYVGSKNDAERNLRP